MKSNPKTVAYIDGANLNRGVKSLGWNLDYARLRVWLSDKYGVGRAYIFIGYITKQKKLYTNLQEAGFTLVFKDVIYDGRGKAKGNCDADLIVRAMRDVCENTAEHTVLVTSDGDYAPLVLYWQEKGMLEAILSPAMEKKCSILLKRTDAPISYIGDQRSNVEAKNEKAPGRDEPDKGPFRSDT